MDPGLPFETEFHNNKTRRATFEAFAIAGMLITALYIGKPIFVPLSLAVFLTFLLSPTVTRLRRHSVPRGLAVAIVALSTFALLIGVTVLVGRQLIIVANDLPRYQITLSEKIRGFRGIASGGSQVDRALEALKTLRGELEAPARPPGSSGVPQPPVEPGATSTPSPVKVVLAEQTTPLDQLRAAAGYIADPLATVGIVVIFVIMTLYSREDVRDRTIRLFGARDLERTTRAMDDAGGRLNRYFVATTAINTAFGLIIIVGLWLIGVPNPILWGIFAMLARFIPYVGVPIAAVIPLVLAFVVDPGWTMLIATVVLFVVSELFISQAVEPFVQAESTGLSPLAIVVSTAFWTLLWGPIGLLLAVPLTVVLVVLGRHIEHLSFLDILLGSQPALSSADRFYQRLLSGDPDEAADQAQSQLKDMPLTAYYDEVVFEALRRATRDVAAGRVDATRLDNINGTLGTFNDIVGDFTVEAVTPSAGDATDAADKIGPATGIDGATTPEIPVRPPVLCLAARNSIDLAAASILALRLEARGIKAVVASAPDVRGQTIAGVDTASFEAVCISAFDIGLSGAHVKFLVRRLRRAMPTAEIVGGFWSLEAGPSSPDAALTDAVVSTLVAAVDRYVAAGLVTAVMPLTAVAPASREKAALG